MACFRNSCRALFNRSSTASPSLDFDEVVVPRQLRPDMTKLLRQMGKHLQFFMGKWGFIMIYLYLLGYSWLHIDSVQIHSYGHLYFLYSYFLGHTDLLEYMVWYVTNGCLRDILGIIMGSIGILREVSSISAPQIIQHMIGHVLRWKAQLLWGTIFLREKGRWSGMTLAQVGKGVTMKWAGNPSWERDDYFGGDDCTINEQMTMFHCRDLVVSTSPAKSRKLGVVMYKSWLGTAGNSVLVMYCSTFPPTSHEN